MWREKGKLACWAVMLACAGLDLGAMEKELKAMHAFLEGQSRLLDGPGLAAVQEQQCRVWVARLQNGGLSPQESAAVAGLIADGPWLPAQRQKLGV